MPRSAETCPSSASSSPAIMRNSVVLPAPLGPTRPIFSPRWSAAEASMNRIWWPTCLETLSRRIICLTGIAGWRPLIPCGRVLEAPEPADKAALSSPCQCRLADNTDGNISPEIPRADHIALSGRPRRRHQRRDPASPQRQPAHFLELAVLGRLRELSWRSRDDGRRPAGDARADPVMEAGDGDALVGLERRHS